MRTILFRGKRIENGEWVYGFYVCDPQGKNEHRIYVTHTHPCGCYLMSYSVIPETVEQYTGLIDKNGKKIFEGDIVKAERWHDSGCYPHAEIETFEVRIPDIYRINIKSIEIVGNVFDNPELLGGDEK